MRGQAGGPVPMSKNAKQRGPASACGTYTMEQGHCWSVHIGQKGTGDSWELGTEPKLLVNS